MYELKSKSNKKKAKEQIKSDPSSFCSVLLLCYPVKFVSTCIFFSSILKLICSSELLSLGIFLEEYHFLQPT
jgi:hypothetical protein